MRDSTTTTTNQKQITASTTPCLRLFIGAIFKKAFLNYDLVFNLIKKRKANFRDYDLISKWDISLKLPNLMYL